MELLYLITKKITEKHRITETAVFGGYGGKKEVGGGNIYFYLFIIK